MLFSPAFASIEVQKIVWRVLALSLFAIAIAGLVLPIPAASGSRLWQPAPDDIFLQEVGRKVSSPVPLTAVALFENHLYAGSTQGLWRLESNRLAHVPELSGPVTRLVAAQDALWVITPGGLHRYRTGAWRKISDLPVTDLAEHTGELLVPAGRRLWRVDGDVLQTRTTNESPFHIARVVSHGQILYVQGEGRLTFLEGERFGGFDMYDSASDQSWDWGELPSTNVRDVLSQGSRMFFATDRGVGVLRGMSLTSIRGRDGLCYEDATCLAKGFTNDLWIGTSRGAIRMVDGQFHYFAGQRWLPDDHVSAMAADAGAVYIATSQGLGIIEYQPCTLEAKAAFYERHLREWGQKRLGFVHKLEWDDGLKEFVREVSDNDGGYSGNYLAAQSYRYAVTRDPEARQEAVNTFQALRWLERMTGIPGFPARSVWAKGERGHKAMHGSGGYPAEWHDTADGRFEWKGDTSSDEICSHFHAVTLFLQHAAQGIEADHARQHLGRIAAHLADHGWQLIDLDGKPTRWGRWDPDYFKTDEGRYERGLQSLELLSFMKTAEILTGDAKFGQAYRQLVELGYPAYTLRQRNTFPPESLAHFDDELAWWSYGNLLRFEKDPANLSTYRRSFERSYEILRIERNPWFNFVYGSLTGNDCEIGPAVAHLREWPLDLVVWSYQNSHRADLRTPPGYVAYKAGTRAFSPRETEPLRWDHWTMQADGGTGGRDVVEPAAWLLAYWMGRYHGFIAAPTVSNQLASAMASGSDGHPRARPYAGPSRPSGF